MSEMRTMIETILDIVLILLIVLTTMSILIAIEKIIDGGNSIVNTGIGMILVGHCQVPCLFMMRKGCWINRPKLEVYYGTA